MSRNRYLVTDTGEVNWEYETVDTVNDTRGGIEYIDDTVWAVDRSGYLYVIDASTGDVLFENTEAVEVLTDDSTVYLSFRPEDSDVFSNGTSGVTIQN